jgi:large subunit ribosomal protein L24
MPRSKIKPGSVPSKILLRRDDVVKVIAGRDKGKTGRVLSIDRRRGRALVEGINLVKRHTRPNPQRQIKGGIAERESSIHVSNLMLMTADGKVTRIGQRVETAGGKARRVRTAVKTGELLEKK